jgi:phospholipid-translocating ATPase
MFAIYSNFSGTSLFESIFLFLFNTIYTSVPVVVYGLSEQTFPEKTLLDNPELYRLNRGNHEMKWYRILMWLLTGFWHAGKITLKIGSILTVFTA